MTSVSRGKAVYRVWGKNLYRLRIWFRSVCTSGKWQFTRTGKHGKIPIFPRFFSMSMKKDLGGIASVKVSFSMRLRMRGFAHNRMDGLASRQLFTPTRFEVLSHSYFSPCFRQISVRFHSNFLVFLCILCVLSPFGTVLVSKLGINSLKNRRRKNSLSFFSK